LIGRLFGSLGMAREVQINLDGMNARSALYLKHPCIFRYDHPNVRSRWFLSFVDVLDRPDLTGSWEEIWRSLESVEFFDLDQDVEYVLLLENATTTAKVGFFLEQHKETLMVDDAHLNPLRSLRPRQPHYFVRGKRKGCQWVKD
jgi:hypothetical protein